MQKKHDELQNFKGKVEYEISLLKSEIHALKIKKV